MTIQLLQHNTSSRYPAVEHNLSRRVRLLRAMFQERPMMSSIFGCLLTVSTPIVAILLDESNFDDQMTAESWLAKAGHSPGLHRDAFCAPVGALASHNPPNQHHPTFA